MKLVFWKHQFNSVTLEPVENPEKWTDQDVI